MGRRLDRSGSGESADGSSKGSRHVPFSSPLLRGIPVLVTALGLTACAGNESSQSDYSQIGSATPSNGAAFVGLPY